MSIDDSDLVPARPFARADIARMFDVQESDIELLDHLYAPAREVARIERDEFVERIKALSEEYERKLRGDLGLLLP